MSEPIVFISHFRIKEGKLDAYRQLQREVTMMLHAEKPRTLVFLTYVNENGTQMTAYAFLEPGGWEIDGRPSSEALGTMRQAATSAGVTLTVQSDHVAGFLRLKPA